VQRGVSRRLSRVCVDMRNTAPTSNSNVINNAENKARLGRVFYMGSVGLNKALDFAAQDNHKRT
jgi:hypothetical protein